jgi:hypothetical protein
MLAFELLTLTPTMKKKKPQTARSYPQKATDVPVTQAMLYSVRDGLESKFMSLEHRFVGLEHRVVSLEHFVRSESKNTQAQIHKIALLVEEQNAKNNIVLDGLTNLFARQERIENHILELRK